MASDSIINQVADSSKSLYQICVKLRQRLREVPGFKQHLDEMREDDSADGSVDPVESMWRCLRKGYPLMTVYNALNPEVLLSVDEGKVAEAKRAKTASFKFVQACLKDLNFPPDECFLIMDLYGDDTTGFVKVIFSGGPGLERMCDLHRSALILTRHMIAGDDGGESCARHLTAAESSPPA